MEPTQALHRALDQTEAIVDATGPDQMDRPTPCTRFDLLELLNHTVASVQGLADAASGRGWDMSLYSQPLLGDDPKDAFSAAAGRLREATSSPSVVDKVWAMPFGEAPGRRAIAIGILEVVQHGWDVAKATGQDAAFDDELSEAALEMAKENMPPDDQRPPEVFGPAVAVPGDAPPHDRLAGFLGRTP